MSENFYVETLKEFDSFEKIKLLVVNLEHVEESLEHGVQVSDQCIECQTRRSCTIPEQLA